MTPQNPSQPSRRPRIWIHPGRGYLKICDDAVGGRNLGIIDPDGWINAKSGKKLTVIQKEGSFVPSQTGATRVHGGSGYSGWADCGSVEGAKDWLRQRFDVVDRAGGALLPSGPVSNPAPRTPSQPHQ
jgi:hypothetical protein